MVAVLGVELARGAPTLTGAVVALGGARPWWIAAAVLAQVASMDMFARLRRRLLATAGVAVRMRDALAGVYVAGAVHLTVPGGAAVSAAYAYRWMRDGGAGVAAVTWTLAAGGVISTAALGALAVAGSLLAGATSNMVTLALDAVVVLALVVGVRWLRRRPDLTLVVGLRLLTWRNMLLRRPPARGKDALGRVVAQLRSVRPGARDWTAAVAYGVGNWLFDIACLAASAAAVGTRGVTLPLLVIAYTAGMAASGISVLPGGIGVVDTAMVLALVAGGIPAATALPAVLLYRLVSLGGVAAAGWLVAAVHACRARARAAGQRSPGATSAV